MGTTGIAVSILFFALMLIAALTSSISMLEVPVSCAIEELGNKRSLAVWWIGGLALALVTLIVYNFATLFAFFHHGFNGISTTCFRISVGNLCWLGLNELSC